LDKFCQEWVSDSYLDLLCKSVEIQAPFSRNPNNKSDEVIGHTTWPAYDKNSHNFLNIGDNLTIDQGLYEERFKVWDELFPLNGANTKWLPKI
jgi:hypothetical protein